MRRANYLPNITSLRFLLALAVILFHVARFSANRDFPFFNDWPIFNKGTEAVYVFFVLSGFLIIKQLFLEKKQTNSINLKSFYKRRMLRIFPLYYLVLTIGFLYYQLVLPYLGYDFENNYDLLTGILLSVFFFANIFSTYSPGGIIEILWSIGIEEQFYIFIAPVLLILPFKKIIWFLLFFTIVYFSFFFLDDILFLRRYDMLFFYFTMGGVFSILLDFASFKRILEFIKYPVLAIFIIYFFTSYFTNHLSAQLYHFSSMILFGLAISVLTLEPIKWLENKTMNYLGKISYGIYMFHAIVMQFVGLCYLKLVSTQGWNYYADVVLINLAVIAITIVVSHLSYRYYESYFLKFKKSKSISRSDAVEM